MTREAREHMQVLERQLMQVRVRGETATDPAVRLECHQIALRLSEALSVAASYHATLLPRLRRLFPEEVQGWWGVGNVAHHFHVGASECGYAQAGEVTTVPATGLPFCGVCQQRLSARVRGGRHG